MFNKKRIERLESQTFRLEDKVFQAKQEIRDIQSRLDTQQTTNELLLKTIKELNNEINVTDRILKQTYKTCIETIPPFKKVSEYLVEYNRLEEVLTQSKCPSLDEVVIKRMQDIEKEVELLVFPNKEEPCSTK
jgi:septal ring factor EnvC (AmiA/AmiB activator)